LAAIAYAVGVVAQKPLLANVSALRVTWLACVVGALSCLPFAGQSLSQLRSSSWPTILWVLYLGLLPTAVGFTTWAYALARSRAGGLAAMTYLVPPMAILLGWLVLAETPTPLALAGGALCLVGVYLTQRGVPSGARASLRRIGWQISRARPHGALGSEHPDRSTRIGPTDTPIRQGLAVAKYIHWGFSPPPGR
jgi:drug/metabolite transporter (DMT)-like permease